MENTVIPQDERNEQEDQFWADCEADHQEDPFYDLPEITARERAEVQHMIDECEGATMRTIQGNRS